MRRIDLRNASIAAALVIAAILITNPFVEIAFNDDWMYAFTVKQLLATGKMTYHCGESAAFITQAYWGALAAKIFGFSFVVLRLSTLPFAVGCAVLCYFLGRDAGLRPGLALLGAILFGLSPMVLPLSASFMSDIPAEFAILLSIYLFARAARTTNIRGAIWLLSCAYLVTILGGISRQTAWLIPVTSGIYIAWLRRREKSIVFVSVAGVVLNVGVGYLNARWFYAQPFSFQDWSFRQTIATGLSTWNYWLVLWIEVWLTALLMVVPAAPPAAWASLAKTMGNLRGRRGLFAAVLAATIAIVSLSWPGMSVAPWLGDIVTARGVLRGMELSGPRPFTLSLPIREVLALVVIVLAWIFLIAAADHVFRRRPIQRLLAAFQPSDDRVVVQCLILFVGAYMLLFLYRAPRGYIYDRYSLPLIPCLAIPLLLAAQKVDAGILRVMMPACVALMAVWGAFAVAGTQDVHALAAARRAALDRLHAAGVPDTGVACGSECDGWTQLLKRGYMITPFIKLPPGVEDPNGNESLVLRCLYRVEHEPMAETTPSEFGTIDYISWLPPFHRRIYIDRYRNPTWLDPNSKLPPPRDYEDFR